MLVIKDSQQSLWDTLLPPEILVLNYELTRVDSILDDDRFTLSFVEKFNTTTGRPTIPVETYLRLMYLNFRYQLGYETPVQEVRS